MGYRQYVTIDDKNRVTGGWSTGENPGIGPGEHDVLAEADGGEAFSLLGVEHPALFTDDKDKIPLYKWESNAVEARTQEEIDADRPGPEPEPEPSDMDRLEAQVYYTAMLTDTLLESEV